MRQRLRGSGPAGAGASASQGGSRLGDPVLPGAGARFFRGRRDSCRSFVREAREASSRRSSPGFASRSWRNALVRIRAVESDDHRAERAAPFRAALTRGSAQAIRRKGAKGRLPSSRRSSRSGSANASCSSWRTRSKQAPSEAASPRPCAEAPARSGWSFVVRHAISLSATVGYSESIAPSPLSTNPALSATAPHKFKTGRSKSRARFHGPRNGRKLGPMNIIQQLEQEQIAKSSPPAPLPASPPPPPPPPRQGSPGFSSRANTVIVKLCASAKATAPACRPMRACASARNGRRASRRASRFARSSYGEGVERSLPDLLAAGRCRSIFGRAPRQGRAAPISSTTCAIGRGKSAPHRRAHRSPRPAPARTSRTQAPAPRRPPPPRPRRPPKPRPPRPAPRNKRLRPSGEVFFSQRRPAHIIYCLI